MELTKLTIKNFQPFADEEQSIDLDTQEITLITGYNSITGSSNGSGKCVASGTKILTKELGEIEIQNLFNDTNEDVLVPKNLHVMTDNGWELIELAWKTDLEELYEVELIDGKKLVASKDHRVMTQRGWIKMKNLNDEDEIVVE